MADFVHPYVNGKDEIADSETKNKEVFLDAVDADQWNESRLQAFVVIFSLVYRLHVSFGAQPRGITQANHRLVNPCINQVWDALTPSFDLKWRRISGAPAKPSFFGQPDASAMPRVGN